jgi:hypothetical protein
MAMLLLPVLIALVACGTNDATPTPANTPTTAAPATYNIPEGKPPGLGAAVPDPKEATETLPAGQLPTFLANVLPALRDKVTAGYQGAVDHYTEYSHMPCYCGCAIYEHAHMSLAQCYIKQKNDDGSIVFTDHSTTCDICQGVASMTLDGLTQNKALTDVRSDVFKKFGYTQIWTDTPAP